MVLPVSLGRPTDSPAREAPLPSPDKVVELVERGGGLSNLESRQALDQAIETGRGGVFLSLTEAQYANAHIPIRIIKLDHQQCAQSAVNQPMKSIVWVECG